MQKFPNKDYKLFKDLVSLKQEDLKILLSKFLKKYYKDNIIETEEYIIGIGNIPIALVAHMDTVFETPPRKIYFDEKKWVFWSPDGLGADDRAGVYIILKILLEGYLPTVIFTTDEEIGGVGALQLTQDFSKPPTDLKYIVQLDRHGFNDAVFYNCTNQDFIDYIETFGFVEEEGIFSDISIICPSWDIAGVNLSVGYLNEHSYLETLSMAVAKRTMERVILMLEEADVQITYDFGNDLYDKFYWYSYNMKCDGCGQIFYDYEMIPVEFKDGSIKHFCPDCSVDKVTWCKICGQSMLKDQTQTQKICYRHKNVH